MNKIGAINPHQAPYLIQSATTERFVSSSLAACEESDKGLP
jgi:hypothetical protein